MRPSPMCCRYVYTCHIANAGHGATPGSPRITSRQRSRSQPDLTQLAGAWCAAVSYHSPLRQLSVSP
ncbi:hypothetical protein B0H67DRAFT_595177 [Lasiosphaeris hirsuta]|uniref:Uncharacterized protein n=1 Tax=Lasiosphaeris hirsuta TaxID=260670 RepID=A0AA39ZR32_9PEZI|nr:hypothetical protein B0H67DRAFT_595177 [Lasiosphaeris hirsuta]